MWYLLGVRSSAWDWQIHCGSFGDSAVNMGISPNLEMLELDGHRNGMTVVQLGWFYGYAGW